MKRVARWLDENFEESILMVLLSTLVVIMTLQVIMRYVFNNSLSWPEEISRYLFIWFVYIGVSYSVKENNHLRIDILLLYMNDPVKKILQIIGDLAFLIFNIIMVVGGYGVFQKILRTGQTSPALLLPMAFVYLSLPIGFLLSIFRMIEKYIIKENI